MDEGDLAEFGIEEAKQDEDEERHRENAGESGEGARKTMLALAEAHREVDDVRTGQELAEAQRLGEILVIHPAALLHQRVMRPIDRTAEAGEAEAEEPANEEDIISLMKTTFDAREVDE